jgi:formate dehydrogenase subunit delta
MATGEHVVYKANQIARNLAYMGRRKAAAATADHLRKFWAPYLRSVLLDEYSANQNAFSPTARQAILLLRTASRPGGATANHRTA